jgi:hypothetical protein
MDLCNPSSGHSKRQSIHRNERWFRMLTFWNNYYGGIIAAIVVIWIVTKILKRPGQSRTPGKKTRWESLWEEGGVRKFLRENWVVVLLVITTIHLIIYTVFPAWYWTHMAMNPKFWVLHLPLLLFALMSPEGTAVLHHKVARVMLIVLLVAMLFVVFLPTGLSAITQPIADWLNKTDLVSNASARNLSRINYAGAAAPLTEKQQTLKDEVEKILDKKNLKPGQRELLLALCLCESTWNQFEADGVTPYHLRELVNGKLVPSEKNIIGVLQINMEPEGHLTEVPRCASETGEDCNPATLEGNINMAIWILNTYGPQRWHCYNKIQGSTFTLKQNVRAPTPPYWSDRIDTINGASITTEGPITIMTDRGQKFPFDKDGELPMPATTFVQVQSRTEESVIVHFSH